MADPVPRAKSGPSVNQIELSAMYPISSSRIGASPIILRLARPDQVIDSDQIGRNPNARLQGCTP